MGWQSWPRKASVSLDQSAANGADRVLNSLDERFPDQEQHNKNGESLSDEFRWPTLRSASGLLHARGVPVNFSRKQLEKESSSRCRAWLPHVDRRSSRTCLQSNCAVRGRSVVHRKKWHTSASVERFHTTGRNEGVCARCCWVRWHSGI